MTDVQIAATEIAKRLQAEIDQLKTATEIAKRLQAEIDQLKIDVEHWQCENENGVSLIAHLSVEADQLTAENARLRTLLSDALGNPEITLSQPWWDKVRHALGIKS